MNKCLKCGKDTKKEKYCSKQCMYDRNKKNINCLNCDKEFISTGNKFCSRKCYHESTLKERMEYICKICGKKFIDMVKANRVYCSLKCQQTESGQIMHKKAKKTLKEKYNVEFVGQIPNHGEKCKKTKLRHYGNENYVNSEKAKKTKLEKYGDENYVNTEKNKKTKLEKYGDKNYNNHEKAIQTLIKTYGEKIHPNTMKKTLERLSKKELGFASESYKKSLMKMYGVTNISYDKGVKEKKAIKRREQILNSIFSGNRLGGLLKPLFTKEEYINSEKIYKFQCIKCSNIIDAYLRDGIIPRCFVCYPRYANYNHRESNLEKEIRFYIEVLLPDETIIKHDRTLISPSEIDIYIPEKKLAIEVNGNYWHSELNGKNSTYHLSKTEACEAKGVQLLQIFEDEWINCQNIVKMRLKHILGVSDKKIYARKCVIKKIDTETKDKFLNDYHLQNRCISSIRYGAYYSDELVAVMTFGRLRLIMHQKHEEGTYELLRFATKYSVVGIADKLLQTFVKEYKPNKIISYADRRWTKSFKNVYDSLRFKLVHNSAPGYWYMLDYSTREHRFNYRKNVLSEKFQKFDSTLTEWQNMQLNGYDRIWDCGQLKYELSFIISI